MDSVTVDEKLADSLIAGGELVEVKDATGKVIGFFAPVTMDLADKYAQAAGQAYPLKERKPMTTAALLEHLETLGPSR